jgi:type IV conjugative transfer system coupling protein TraD
MTDIFNNITRGGQLQIHQLRMLHQVCTFAVIVSLIITSIFVFYRFQKDFTTHQIRACFDYGKAKILYSAGKSRNKTDVKQNVLIRGKTIEVFSYRVLSSKHYRKVVGRTIAQLEAIGKRALWWFFSSMILTLGIWLSYGKTQKKTEITKGNMLVTPKEMRKQLYKQKLASDLKIGELPLVKNRESQHILVTGTTGAGKSNAFNMLLPQIRARPNQAMIVDVTGQFVAKYYNPATDIIFNPYDDRSVRWDIWADCYLDSHYEAFAESIIPAQQSSGNDIWDMSSRLVLVEVMRKMALEPNCSIERLLELISQSSLLQLEKYLEGTYASKVITSAGEKTAYSVLMNLTTHISALKLLHLPGTMFSVREWISNPENKGSWLFVTARSDQISSLRNLMSAMTDIAINSLLSLTPGRQEKTWFVLDELPKLNKLSSLATGLAESRKYGGCILAGIQSMPQLTEIYGHAASNAMLDMFNSLLFFRSQNPQTTEWIAKMLGVVEQEELQEHMSYGASSMKDGVSFSRQKRAKSLITPSEIANLADLELFVQYAGYNITKLKTEYQVLPDLHPGFVLRTQPARAALPVAAEDKNLKAYAPDISACSTVPVEEIEGVG